MIFLSYIFLHFLFFMFFLPSCIYFCYFVYLFFFALPSLHRGAYIPTQRRGRGCSTCGGPQTRVEGR